MNLTTLETLPETPLDLERYLRKMPLHHVAGTRNSGDCILSRFLSKTYRRPVFVTDHLIIIGEENFALSPWMSDFISAVRSDGRKLTAGLALQLLGAESERRAA